MLARCALAGSQLFISLCSGARETTHVFPCYCCGVLICYWVPWGLGQIKQLIILLDKDIDKENKHVSLDETSGNPDLSQSSGLTASYSDGEDGAPMDTSVSDLGSALEEENLLDDPVSRPEDSLSFLGAMGMEQSGPSVPTLGLSPPGSLLDSIAAGNVEIVMEFHDELQDPFDVNSVLQPSVAGLSLGFGSAAPPPVDPRNAARPPLSLEAMGLPPFDTIFPGAGRPPLEQSAASRTLGQSAADRPLERNAADRALDKSAADRLLQESAADRTLGGNAAGRVSEQSAAGPPLDLQSMDQPSVLPATREELNLEDSQSPKTSGRSRFDRTKVHEESSDEEALNVLVRGGFVNNPLALRKTLADQANTSAKGPSTSSGGKGSAQTGNAGQQSSRARLEAETSEAKSDSSQQCEQEGSAKESWAVKRTARNEKWLRNRGGLSAPKQPLLLVVFLLPYCPLLSRGLAMPAARRNDGRLLQTWKLIKLGGKHGSVKRPTRNPGPATKSRTLK